MSKNAWLFFCAVLASRALFVSLVKNDCRNKYVNHFLGIFWAFIQPMVMVLIFRIITLSILVLGAAVFKKLCPHFADVLYND